METWILEEMVQLPITMEMDASRPNTQPGNRRICPQSTITFTFTYREWAIGGEIAVDVSTFLVSDYCSKRERRMVGKSG